MLMLFVLAFIIFVPAMSAACRWTASAEATPLVGKPVYPLQHGYGIDAL